MTVWLGTLLAGISGRALWIAGSVIAAVSVVAGAWLWGHSIGVQEGRVRAMADTVAAYQKREGIDNEVRGMDAYNLCLELGGLRDDCNELRGLEKNPG